MASETDDQAKGWQWIYERDAEGVRDPAWLHGDLVDAVGHISDQLLRRVGDCRLPMYVGPKEAEQLLALWTIVSGRHIQINQSRADSQNAECHAHYEGVKRSVGRARRRPAWEPEKVKA